MMVCEKVCEKCTHIDHCDLLQAIKNHPSGATAQELSKEMKMPLGEISKLIFQLCAVGWFIVLRK